MLVVSYGDEISVENVQDLRGNTFETEYSRFLAFN